MVLEFFSPTPSWKDAVPYHDAATTMLHHEYDVLWFCAKPILLNYSKNILPWSCQIVTNGIRWFRQTWVLFIRKVYHLATLSYTPGMWRIKETVVSPVLAAPWMLPGLYWHSLPFFCQYCTNSLFLVMSEWHIIFPTCWWWPFGVQTWPLKTAFPALSCTPEISVLSITDGFYL